MKTRFAIKVCGLTTVADARWAVEQGATYLGFVLYRGSPRCVTPKHLRRTVEGLPRGVRVVGVFVNEDSAVVRSIAEECRLHAIQLHGDEDPRLFRDMPVPVWRAVRLQGGVWTPDPAAWQPEQYLMEAASPGYGGSGMTVDWDAAAQFAAQHRALLAGGLTPANVAAAIEKVKPAGVDVSSGVEAMPGRKDPEKVKAFIRAARKAAKRIAGGDDQP
jgi:phosphoribosylanthranilate isomerase